MPGSEQTFAFTAPVDGEECDTKDGRRSLSPSAKVRRRWPTALVARAWNALVASERKRRAERSVLLHGMCATAIALAETRHFPASVAAALTTFLIGVCGLTPALDFVSAVETVRKTWHGLQRLLGRSVVLLYEQRYRVNRSLRSDTVERPQPVTKVASAKTYENCTYDDGFEDSRPPCRGTALNVIARNWLKINRRLRLLSTLRDVRLPIRCRYDPDARTTEISARSTVANSTRTATEIAVETIATTDLGSSIEDDDCRDHRSSYSTHLPVLGAPFDTTRDEDDNDANSRGVKFQPDFTGCHQ
ncbi:Hypothetical protein CINCED_3A014911 [Cinara cedri]|uniref:Uncharacterized protein n=1 Tax=Cinara cedri TaxID=506608 RepID=A0A5E4NEQ1_9HEMI|nr:Hypothetical protein CINCED_3A014911 [Cinara cedri]